MSINRQAYNAIKAIVGERYISEDPAIMEGYRSVPQVTKTEPDTSALCVPFLTP
jgi:uncharacterized protein (UPF0297 family)